MKSLAKNLIFIVALLYLGTQCASADAIENRQVQFEKGASSATVKDSIKGDKTIDYKLRARAGQSMTVDMKTDHTASYFNILPPGSNDVAIFIGSTEGNNWSGILKADGEYTIRVYLMRSAARRNETANYTLTVSITGNPAPAQQEMAVEGDARVSGTPYHATGMIPCSMGDAAPGSAQCEFGVIRGASGNAELHVTPPGGIERILIFADGKVTASDGSKVNAVRSGDNWVVDVNDYEHYRIPDAVIFGG